MDTFKGYQRKFLTFDFWDSVFVKIVVTLTSVKVWGLIAVTTIATWLLLNQHIVSKDWTTAITAVYATIYGMREMFKISKMNTEFQEVILDEDEGFGESGRRGGRASKNAVSTELPDDGFQVIR